MKYILLFLLSFNCLAGEIVQLNKGDAAPFKGALVAPKQMNKFRKINEENKLLKKKTTKLQDLALVKERKFKIVADESAHYQKLYRRQQVKTFWSNVGYFVLGVAVTGFAAKAAIEATR